MERVAFLQNRGKAYPLRATKIPVTNASQRPNFITTSEYVRAIYHSAMMDHLTTKRPATTLVQMMIVVVGMSVLTMGTGDILTLRLSGIREYRRVTLT